ncbi:LysR family transcriptional regulator [Seohaeicola zhoushanensis]
MAVRMFGHRAEEAMDIRQLRYFIAIAEAGSLSAAAQRLHIAQPSLSQHLAAMEQELNLRLVERSPRGSTLTAEGRCCSPMPGRSATC